MTDRYSVETMALMRDDEDGNVVLHEDHQREVAQLQARVAELEAALQQTRQHYRAFLLAVEQHASFDSDHDDPSVGLCSQSAANRMIEGTWEYLGGRPA